MTTTTRENLVVKLLKSIETKDPEGFAVISTEQYIQHNIFVADGRKGFVAFVQSLPDGFAKVDTRRVFEDGDYVVAHSEIDIGGARAVFDIFRFDGDRIVEHWDAAQALTSPNPSGRSLLDGQQTLADPGVSLDQCKAVAKGFVENVLMVGDLSNAGDYVGDTYLQHHPLVRDGLDGLREAFSQWQTEGIEVRYEKIHHVLGKGDMVLVVTEGCFNGASVAYYDMFRIDQGKIAEHWDVVEEIPARESWANNNGKF